MSEHKQLARLAREALDELNWGEALDVIEEYLKAIPGAAEYKLVKEAIREPEPLTRP